MGTLFPTTITYEFHTDNGSSGSYNAAGNWVPGETGTETFQGSVQPASGKEIESLPVGREDTGKVKVYSSTPLPVAKEAGDEAGAIVYWNNRKWELVYDAGYQNSLIPHYKYIGEYRGEI